MSVKTMDIGPEPGLKRYALTHFRTTLHAAGKLARGGKLTKGERDDLENGLVEAAADGADDEGVDPEKLPLVWKRIDEDGDTVHAAACLLLYRGAEGRQQSAYMRTAWAVRLSPDTPVEVARGYYHSFKDGVYIDTWEEVVPDLDYLEYDFAVASDREVARLFFEKDPPPL